MIVVSLDEGGQFELLPVSGRTRCMFVGGLVFSCETEIQVANELDRIEEYLKRTCIEQGAEYPRDLHYNRNVQGSVINAEKAQSVKHALGAEFHDFCNGTGDWENCKPNGTYSLYAMVADSDGMYPQGHAPTSNLLDDHYAANLYEHIAYRAIENLLFYNPKISEKKSIRLDLATRVIPINASSILANDTAELGYRKRRNSDGTFDYGTVHVTDEGSYRAFLESAAERAQFTEAHFDINVQSINYNRPQKQQGFLYLADTICSLYQDALGNTQSIGLAVERLKDFCVQTIEEQAPMIWAYNPLDKTLRLALQKEASSDYFEALKYVYTATDNNERLTEAYNSLWFSEIVERISETTDADAVRNALSSLRQYLDSKYYKLRYARSILQTLSIAVSNLSSDKQKGEISFWLSVTEMIIHNHYGEYDKAKESYLKCIQFSQYTTVESFLEIQNMYSVSLLDALQIEEAMNVAKSTVDYYEMIQQIKQEIYSDSPYAFVSYGRAISQLGQCLAFSEQYSEAVLRFDEAIVHFNESPEDYRRTTSYLLHALIENGNKESFEEHAEQYFGYRNIAAAWKQRRYIPEANDKYAIYVYVKALQHFYRDQLANKELIAIAESVRKCYQQNRDGHPWELILHYCAMLTLFTSGSFKLSDGFDKETNNAVDHPEHSILHRIIQESHERYVSVRDGKTDAADCNLTYMYR